MARPCHGGLIFKKNCRSPACSRCLFFVHSTALSDNTAPKIFHAKRQTQHVRHTIPYRLYHHYFFEHIKDIDRQPVLVKLCSYFARLSVSPGSLLELDSLPWVPGSFRYLVFVRWFPHFSLSLVRLLTNVDPLHASLINYAFVINNIKPEQVHKCADNDNPANH